MSAERQQPAVASSDVSRIMAIDALRGLAILWVVAYHAWFLHTGVPRQTSFYIERLGDRLTSDPVRFPAAFCEAVFALGYQGVPMFMLLSGVSLYLSSTRSGGAQSSLASFYYTRLRRLLVPYWASFFVFILGACGVALLRVAIDGGTFREQYWHGVLGAYDLPYHLGWQTFFVHMGVYTRLGHTAWTAFPPPVMWFIPALVSYALIFPFMKRALDRIGPGWFILACVTVTVGAKVAFQASRGLLNEPGPALLTGVPPFRMTDFALGMAIGYLIAHRRDAIRRYISSPLDAACLIAPGVALLVAGSVFDDMRGYRLAIAYELAVAGLALVALPMLFARSDIVEQARPARAFAWLGPASFAVLIINAPMMLLVSLTHFKHVEGAAWWLFVALVYVPPHILLARPLSVLLGLMPRAPRPPAIQAPQPPHTSVAAEQA